MRNLSRVDIKDAQDGAIAPSRIKVCMHVRGTARTDGRVMREAISLVEAGYEVSIVDVEGKRTLPSEEVVEGICLKHIIWPRWFIPSHFKPWFLVKMAQMIILSALKLILTQADIYHAHDETALPACYIAARLRHKALIYDAHELPLSEPNVTRWTLLCALSRHILEHIVPKCAAIITVSPPIAQEIHCLYHGPKASLIRNVPKYRTVSKSDRLRQYLGLSQNTRIALYQGNIQHDRGLDQLIRTAAFLEPGIVIVIMGKESKETLLQLNSLIASESVADRVKIIPQVPYEELLDWTASADIGLLVYSPSYSKNVQMCLPNKLFEYLMAGLPVLVSSLDAVVDILKIYDVGHVVLSLTPRDIGMAINTMVANSAALDCMQRNALKAAQYDFCWEKEHHRLIQLYDSILTD